MTTTVTKLRCQRSGCDQSFSADDNPEGSCQYHPGPPLFHDGGKEWSCCKKRSHDFSLFLELPGCTTGKHTSEKQSTNVAPSPRKPVIPAANAAAAANCNRCKQGFFCAEHGSKYPIRVPTQAPKATTAKPVFQAKPAVAVPPKFIDLNTTQTCANGGCGKEFTEKENTDSACSFHPGPAIFHDRSKGWGCCNTHVKEFDEFLEIPPCATGWHSARSKELDERDH